MLLLSVGASSGAASLRESTGILRSDEDLIANSSVASSMMWARPQPSSSVCVCLYGEIRALTFQTVRDRLRHTVIKPLQADVFLAVSPSWTVTFHRGWTPRELTADNVSAIVQDLRPVRTSVLRDTELLFGGGNFSNTSHHREMLRRYLPSCIPQKGADLITSPCHWLLMPGARLRSCLALIEDAEQQHAGRSGARYAWVYRMRPDIVSPCRLRPPAFYNRSIIFVDYFAVMPRPAADVALREIPLRASVSYCRSHSLSREWCNPCVTQTYGIDTFGYASRHDSRYAFDIARHCPQVGRGASCTGFSEPNIREEVASDCPHVEETGIVSHFPGFGGPGVRDLQTHCHVSVNGPRNVSQT